MITIALEIFKLVGSIFVDNSAANESISKTDEKAQSLGDKMLKGVGTAAKWGAGLAAGAATGATALFGIANSAAGTMDRIDKLSAKVGMSKKAFQEWDYVLAQNGMDAEKLQVGVKTLTAQMDAAASGNKSAAANFSALGLSIMDASGALKSQEQMTNEAIMALANMENGTEKARLATEMFGKAGIEMMPMLNGGAEGITELKDRAHELGLVMSDEAVTAGVVFGDTLDDVKKTFGAIVTKVGAEVMPMFQSVLDWVLSNMPTIQAVCGAVFGAIKVAVDILFSAISTVYSWIEQYAPMVIEIVEPVALKIVEFWNKQLKPMFDAMITFFNTVLVPAFKLVFTNMIMPIVDAAFQYIIDIWNGTLKPVFNGIIDFLTGVFTGNWKQAFEGLSNIVSGIFNGMISIVKVPLNIIIGVINKFIEGINKIKIPDWVPGIGGKSPKIPTIPLLAKGGNIVEAGRVIVGDAGPEMLDLPAGARVTPLNGKNPIVSEDMTAVVDELKAIRDDLVAIRAAILSATEISWDDRTFARVVRKNVGAV